MGGTAIVQSGLGVDVLATKTISPSVLLRSKLSIRRAVRLIAYTYPITFPLEVRRPKNTPSGSRGFESGRDRQVADSAAQHAKTRTRFATIFTEMENIVL